MSLANFLGLFDLLVVGSLSWIVTGLLWWLYSKQPDDSDGDRSDYLVLGHVRLVMLVVSLNVTVFGAVFVINDYFPEVFVFIQRRFLPWVPVTDISKYITRTAIALLLIPSLGWLLVYLPRLLVASGNGNGAGHPPGGETS